TFKYSGLQSKRNVDGSLTISFDITNTGDRQGAEIAQVYVTPVDASSRPAKELKGFTKLSLAPGEKRRAVVTIPSTALRRYDTTLGKWMPLEVASILVGLSSDSLPLETTL
ncbi:MAG: fibronectin type III-like domain-contianing protein, partial [Candidatus Amulumruptor sp.]|nr:fibronectin type III-like domain-contianing protein [Candidatus Amulumruptor sp.]